MTESTTAPRTCEVCGDPIRPDNRYGICSGRGKPECARARDRKRQPERPTRPPSPPKPKPVRAAVEIRQCEVCGGPLRSDNETGICASRKNPACRRELKRKQRAAVTPERSSYIKAGDTFGRWTALEDYSRDNRKVLVRCACGTERRIRGSFLVGGTGSRSCGCTRSGPRKGKPPYFKAGEVYGRLTVLEDVRLSKDRVRCRCKCGNETMTPTAANVKAGITRSCGCLSRERQATQGGLSRHVLYSIWNSMLDRCTNPKVKGYHNYGGRGIKVCDRWLDLRVFIEDVEREIGPRPAGVGPSGRVLYSFDRKDNDGNYEPGNICWSTSAEQVMNQRKVAKLTLGMSAVIQERDALAARVAELEALLP